MHPYRYYRSKLGLYLYRNDPDGKAECRSKHEGWSAFPIKLVKCWIETGELIPISKDEAAAIIAAWKE